MSTHPLTVGPSRRTQNYFLNGDSFAEKIRANAISFLNRLDLSKRWKITVEAATKNKTSKQDRALWGVAYKAIGKHYGYSGDAEIKHLHTCFCGDYWGWKVGPMGYNIPVRTTTVDEDGNKVKCSAEDMAGLYALVQRTAAADGCDVPDPDPLWFLNDEVDL
jgi:hypothetical protein